MIASLNRRLQQLTKLLINEIDELLMSASERNLGNRTY